MYQYHRDPRCELSILAHVSALSLSDDPITITSQCGCLYSSRNVIICDVDVSYNVMGTSGATDKR
jgi:hypothetical protein